MRLVRPVEVEVCTCWVFLEREAPCISLKVQLLNEERDLFTKHGTLSAPCAAHKEELFFLVPAVIKGVHCSSSWPSS